MRCAVSTGLPRRDQRPRAATTTADERPRQGRRDPRAPAPDHGPATTATRRPGPVHASGPGLAGSPVAPAATNRAEPPAAAGAPGDRAALAPGPDRPPACQKFPAPPGRTATNHPVDPPPRPAPGLREHHLGIPPHPRRTTRTGRRIRRPTVWEILHEAGIDPAPQRTSSTWATFLRSQSHAIIAADFFETTTLTGAKLYVLAVIDHATRRIPVLGVTAHPTAAWVTQTARKLVMDLEDSRCPMRYLLRDRDGQYPALFDTILAGAQRRGSSLSRVKVCPCLSSWHRAQVNVTNSGCRSPIRGKGWVDHVRRPLHSKSTKR